METYKADVIKAEMEPSVLLLNGKDEQRAFKHSKTKDPNAKKATYGKYFPNVTLNCCGVKAEKKI